MTFEIVVTSQLSRLQVLGTGSSHPGAVATGTDGSELSPVAQRRREEGGGCSCVERWRGQKAWPKAWLLGIIKVWPRDFEFLYLAMETPSYE